MGVVSLLIMLSADDLSDEVFNETGPKIHDPKSHKRRDPSAARRTFSSFKSL